MARYATILGTGMYLPENEITNETFSQWMGEVSPKLAEVVFKFEASSGIKTRFYAPDDWATSDLATEAGKAAIADLINSMDNSCPNNSINSRQIFTVKQ